VAEASSKGRFMSSAERQLMVADNLPVLAAAVVPSLLAVMAGADLLECR